jgi:hypothetical protein
VGKRCRFQEQLQSNIYNYDEPYNQLIYLDKVHNMISECMAKHKCNEAQPCHMIKAYLNELLFVEQEIKSINPKFLFTIQRPNVIAPLVTQNLVSLIQYPDAARTYQSETDKLQLGKYDRNVLDDFRHCLETLLKNKLPNNKAIEIQVKDLGGYLKDKGIDDALRNLVTCLLTYYIKYQNDNIKHGEAIPESEIEFAINQSLALIRCIANN